MQHSSALSRLLVLCVFFVPLAGCNTLIQCDGKRFEVPKDSRVNKNKKPYNKYLQVPKLWKAPVPRRVAKAAPTTRKAPVDASKLAMEPRWGHHSGVHSMVLSPDGSTALTAESQRQILVWSLLPTLRLKRRIGGFSTTLRGFSLSADGRRFAVLEGAKTVSVWSIEGKLLRRHRFSQTLTALRYATVENKLAVGTSKGEVLWLRASTLAVARKEQACAGVSVTSALFDSLQQWLMVGCATGGLRWFVGKKPAAVLFKTLQPATLALSAKDNLLAVGESSGRVVLLNKVGDAWKQLSSGLAHLKAISSLGFNKAGTRLVSAGKDRKLTFWKWKLAGKSLKLQIEHWTSTKGAVRAVAWFDSDRRLLTGDSKGLVQAWNQKGEFFQTIQPASIASHHLSFSRRGNLLSAAGPLGSFAIWDLKTLKPVLSSERQTAALSALRFSIDSNHLLSLDSYNAVFWDFRGQMMVDIVRPGKGAVFTTGSHGSDWTEVWLGTAQHGVQWWTIRGGPTPLFRHSKPQFVSAVAFHRMRRLGIAGTAGGEVFVYRLRSDERRLLASKKLSRQLISHLGVHPKKPEIVVVSGGAVAIVSKKLKPLATYQHPNTVQTAQFSPDGKNLAISGEEGDVLLWNTKSKQITKRYKGCLGQIKSVAFSSSMPLLAGSCTDGRIYLWNLKSGEKLAELVLLPKKEWLVRIKGNRFIGSQKAVAAFALRHENTWKSLQKFGKQLFSPASVTSVMKQLMSHAKPAAR